jgi:acyl CoA:acetate/3-ketoacid CoA transferase alpha subunit
VAELMPLDEAVREIVHDGDSVALEGFTHLIPVAAGHEIVRQERRELTLIRMTPAETEPPSDEELRVLRELRSAMAEATA